MTCFWTGIIRSLSPIHFQSLSFDRMPNPIEFIKRLKERNGATPNVMWMGCYLSESQINENYQAVKDYDINKIQEGHLTGGCDYFLCLICELLNCDIEHIILGQKILYKYTGVHHTGITLKYASDKGHFWNR